MIWWNSNSETIECVEIDGKWYALYGWNGEEYTSCWEVQKEEFGKFWNSVDKTKYIIREIQDPIEFDEEGEPTEYETTGYEIIDYYEN